MRRRPRRNHSAAFKAKVALAAIKGDRTLAQLRNSSTSTPIRSHHGKRSSRAELPMFWPRQRQRSNAPGGRCEVTARKSRRADARE